MEPRPRIKLNLSQFDKTMEMVCKVFLVVMWVLTVYTFLNLPTVIPIHFNASGQADDYGNKVTLLILPILATLIYFGLTKLNKYPHIFNYPTTITTGNAHQQYTLATRMIRFLKLAVLVIFTYIILSTYLTSSGIANGLGVWFLPLTAALFLIPVIVLILSSLKKKSFKPMN